MVGSKTSTKFNKILCIIKWKTLILAQLHEAKCGKLPVKVLHWLWQNATKDCTICSGISHLVSQFLIPCKSCDFFMTLHSVCERHNSVPGLKEYPILQLYVALVFQRVDWFSNCTSLWGNNCGYPHVMAANETESVRTALFWTAEPDTSVVTKNKNTDRSNNKISPLLMFCEILLVMCTIHNLTPSNLRQFIINTIQSQVSIFISIIVFFDR
jgi:hypothetical protein